MDTEKRERYNNLCLVCICIHNSCANLTLPVLPTRFKQEMAKYIAAKKRLEDKLEKRRHAREEEFRGLGKHYGIYCGCRTALKFAYN